MNRLNKWLHPSKLILINMELDNGDNLSFVTKMHDISFDFGNGTYFIDLSLMYYNMSSKLWCLDYHQSMSIPVKRKIDVDKIKDAIDYEKVECHTAINPKNIKRAQESSIISQIFQGANLEKKIDNILMMGYISVALIVMVLCGVGWLVYQISQMIPK